MPTITVYRGDLPKIVGILIKHGIRNFKIMFTHPNLKLGVLIRIPVLNRAMHRVNKFIMKNKVLISW